MNTDELNYVKFESLKKIANEFDLSGNIQMNDEEQLRNHIKNYIDSNNIEKYRKIEKIGEGRDGIVYVVRNLFGKKYAMKCFKKDKSRSMIKKEYDMQDICSGFGICPKTIDINLEKKYFIMELYDLPLFKLIEKQNGVLSKTHQKQLVFIYETLDKIKIFHNDPNISNYMIKDDKVYIIDFGMSKNINKNLIDSYNTQDLNMIFMLMGFIINLKKTNCPPQSYEYLSKFLSDENKQLISL